MTTKRAPGPFDAVRESAARLGESADRLLAHIDRMTNSHTPGPWGIMVGDAGPIIRSANKCCIAQSIKGLSSQEREANARLIAAAPDLLGALQTLIDMDVAYMRGSKVADAVDVARAAIAKATGASE